MTFQVPLQKGPTFSKDLFELISNELVELKLETDCWPDRTVFSGRLGKELLEFVSQSNWDLAKFGPTHQEGIVDKIRFEYSKPLSQIEDRDGTVFDQQLKDRQINGILDASARAKLIDSYSRPAFVIERTIRPYREIKLKR
jgi:hypothetical protein